MKLIQVLLFVLISYGCSNSENEIQEQPYYGKWERTITLDFMENVQVSELITLSDNNWSLVQRFSYSDFTPIVIVEYWYSGLISTDAKALEKSEVNETYLNVSEIKLDQFVRVNTEALRGWEPFITLMSNITLMNIENTLFSSPDHQFLIRKDNNDLYVSLFDLAFQTSFTENSNLPTENIDTEPYHQMPLNSDWPINNQSVVLEKIEQTQSLWDSSGITDYMFTYSSSRSDCPTASPVPPAVITVVGGTVSSVYIPAFGTYSSTTLEWPTIDDIFRNMAELANDNPEVYSKNETDKYLAPEFDESYGYPTSYFVDRTKSNCDSLSVRVSGFQ